MISIFYPARLIRIACCRSSLILILLLILGHVLAVRPAAADLAACEHALLPAAAAGNTMVLTLTVDRISVPQSVPGFEDPKQVANALSFKIGTNLDALELSQVDTGPSSAGGIDVRFRVIPCPQREPQDSQDIRVDAEQYLNHKVLIELWGLFDLDEAIISHAILPLYVRGAPPDVQVGDVFVRSFRYNAPTHGGQKPELRFLKNVFETSLPLRAYVATGVAAVALRERLYDLARHNYCLAWHDMRDVESEQGRLSADDQRLLNYVEKMSVEVIERAKADSEYSGALGTPLIAAGTGCDRPL